MLEGMLEGVEAVERYIREKGIKYFRPQEFVCRHCGRVKIHKKIIDTLEELREYLGKPIIITSAYRCPIWNKLIGGVPNSAHTRGYAVDIRATDSKTRHQIINFLMQKGINRIGLAPVFLHFDIDPDKPAPAIWVYTPTRRHIA